MKADLLTICNKPYCSTQSDIPNQKKIVFMILKTGVSKDESGDEAGMTKRLFSTFHLINSGV